MRAPGFSTADVHRPEGSLSVPTVAGIKCAQDVKDIAEIALARGWTVDRTAKGHLRFLGPDGEGPVIVSPHSNGPRQRKNTLAELRRNGLTPSGAEETVIDLTEPEEPAMPAPLHTADRSMPLIAEQVMSYVRSHRKDDRARAVANIVGASLSQEVPAEMAAFGGMVIASFIEWAQTVDVVHGKDAKAAEDLAAECEARAVQAEKARDRLQAERDDLAAKFKAERDRAEAERERADRVEAALKPLRALLGES